MANSQERFVELVDLAYDGSLQLPAFQRDWKWKTKQVISLYDSLRKGYPIGNFLCLDISEAINLSPRGFSGSKPTENPVRLVLDGQQRITSGISLLKGMGDGKTRYFLNLKKLQEQVSKKNIDLDDPEAILKFVLELDETDDYVQATRRTTVDQELLLNYDLLSTKALASGESCSRALEEYEDKYPTLRRFLRFVVAPHFVVGDATECPVITLEKKTPLHAVTKIFATINTTGKQLTPIEIVTALLFAYDVNLRSEIETYHDASFVLKTMDPIGEIFLQTIALLAGESPKKSLLPKTISKDRFRKHFNMALDLLDKVGEFLTKEMGVGLTETNKLVPYDSIFAPMALVMKHIDTLKGKKRAFAMECLEMWFIGTALDQRYQEGVHNKQSTDCEDVIQWIENGDEYKPSWISSILVPLELKNTDTPSGARGKLIKCLINRKRPRDMLEAHKVGYFDGSTEPQYHHVWPKQFCKPGLLPGWDPSKPRHKSDLALNVIPTYKTTNRGWNDKNPSEQLSAFKNKITAAAKRRKILDDLLISKDCEEIMQRKNKKAKDYLDFLDARFDCVAEELARWGFESIASSEDEDSIPDESD